MKKSRKRAKQLTTQCFQDFNDSDSEGSLEIVHPDAPATVEEDADEIPKIEEFTEHTVQYPVFCCNP